MSGFGVAGTPLGIAWGAAFRRKNPTGSPTLPGFQSGCGGCAGAKVWNSFWFGSGFAVTGQAGQTLAGSADNGVRLASGALQQVGQTTTGILDEPGVFPASGATGQGRQTTPGTLFSVFIPPTCDAIGRAPLVSVWGLAFRRAQVAGSLTLPGLHSAAAGKTAGRLWNDFYFGSLHAQTGQAIQTTAGTGDPGSRAIQGATGQAGQTATGTAAEPGVVILRGGTGQKNQTFAATASNSYSGPYDHFVVAQSDEIRTYYNTTLDWNQTGLGTVYAVAIDPAGNVYCAGTVVDGITTRKYNTSGELAWSANHGAQVNALVVDSDGNVYTGGVRSSSLTTRKYNSAGELQWSKDHGADVASLFLDGAENLYAAGVVSGYNIRKYTPAGDLSWSRNWGGVNLTGVVTSAAGSDIYVVETQRILRKYSYVTDDYYLQWSKDTLDYIYALAIDSNGLVVTGGNGALSGYSLYKYTVGGSISYRKIFTTGPTFYALSQALNGIIYAGSDVFESNSVRRYGNTGSVTMLVATGATVRAIAFHKKAGRVVAPGAALGLGVGLPDTYVVSPHSGVGQTGQASQTAVGTAELSGMFFASGTTAQRLQTVSGTLTNTFTGPPERFVTIGNNYLAAYNSDTVAWEKTDVGEVYEVKTDAAGNVYCAGGVVAGKTTRKYDKDGNLLWSVNHGATVRALAVDAAGNVYTSGAVASDLTTRKYDQDGNLLWSRNHGQTVRGVFVDGVGNVYTNGDYEATSQSTARKYAVDGTLLWSRNFEFVNQIVVDSEESCYVVGTDSFAVAKYDKNGNWVWNRNWLTYLYDIAIDAYDQLYIVGARNAYSQTLTKFNKYNLSLWSRDHGDDCYAVTVDSANNIWSIGWLHNGITVRKYSVGGAALATFNASGYELAVLPGRLAKTVVSPGLALRIHTGVPTDHVGEGFFAPSLALGLGLGVPAIAGPNPPELEVLARAGPVRQIWEAALGGGGQSDVLLLPVEALECRRRVNESAWLSLSIPSATPALVAAIQERLPGDVVVMVSAAGTRGEFLRATVTDLAFERTAGAGSIQLTARVIPTAFTRQNRVLFGVTQRTLDNGRRTVRCAVDPAVRPNDAVFDGLWTFVAGSIQYRITPTTASMTVVEILA